MYFNRFDQSREFREKLVYGFEGEAMGKALLRPLQHIFIFQK